MVALRHVQPPDPTASSSAGRVVPVRPSGRAPGLDARLLDLAGRLDLV